MPDLLVPLYNLPPAAPKIEALREVGIVVRRARPFDLSRTARFVSHHFSERWENQATFGFGQHPIMTWIAIYEKRVIGFAVVDATARGFFGPTGVDPDFRGKGVGVALLLASLHGLYEQGYAYGIIGRAGPVDFYVKTVAATVIANSETSIWHDLLGPDGEETSLTV